ncbi:MAG TPA: bacillolysin, partial [Nocardioides sp.]
MRRLSIAVTAGLAATAGFAVPLSPATSAPGSGSSEGTARVFMVNPVQSSNDQGLTDQKDAASAVPDSAYAQVPLTHLDGSGYLRGDYAVVESSTGTPAYSTTNSYSYDRHQDQFEQV